MKKALVILLTLAVAGGLFAQTFTWVGHAEGGFGMLNRGDSDDAVFGAIAPHAWVNGTRLQLELNGVNADGNAGFRARFRANISGTAAGTNQPFIHQAWAWVNLFDGLLELRGGRVFDTALALQDPIFGSSLFSNQHGFLGYLRPMDILTVGFGGFVPTAQDPGTTWEEGGLTLWGGVGVSLAGLMEVRAQLNHSDLVTNAQVGVQVTALDFLPINAFVRMHNLQDFGDYGELFAYAFVGLNLVENLDLNLGGVFGMSQVDNTDPFMAFGGWLQFTGLGAIVPRLDAWFVSGGEYNFGYGFNPTGSNIDWVQARWDSDMSYISIRPALRFRATPAAWWEVGGLFNIELGDVGAGGGTSDDTFTWGLFTAVRIGF